MAELRNFQVNTINTIQRELDAGNRHLSIMIPAGCGKTTLAARLAADFRQRHLQVAVVGNEKFLLDQFLDVFHRCGVDGCDFINASHCRSEQRKLRTADCLIILDLSDDKRFFLSNLDVDYGSKIVLNFEFNPEFHNIVGWNAGNDIALAPVVLPMGSALSIKDVYTVRFSEKALIAERLDQCIQTLGKLLKEDASLLRTDRQADAQSTASGDSLNPVLKILQDCQHDLLESVSQEHLENLKMKADLGFGAGAVMQGFICRNPFDAVFETTAKKLYNLYSNYKKGTSVASCDKSAPATSQTTWKKYQMVIENCVGGEVWKKFGDATRKYLITALRDFESQKNEQEYYDFSAICMNLSKAVDTEVAERVYKDYVSYLQKNQLDRDAWPTALIKNGEILEPDDFTMGTVVYTIGYRNHRIKNFRDYKIFLRYAREKMYQVTLGEAQVREKIDELCECVENVRLKYRNVAAHRRSQDYRTAKECMDYLLLEDKMLKKLLESTQK